MSFVMRIGMLVLLGAAGASGRAPTAEVDASGLRARLEAAPPPHPRLFLPASEMDALRARVDSDASLRGVYAYILANTEIVMGLPPVEREQVGKRLLGVSRTVLQRVTYLAFAYRMTGEEALLRRAEAEMLAAAAFTDWNPSHFLDVAEMTAALAIGYDWLHDDLRPEAREAIRDAILEKGLNTSMKGGSWVRTANNWNQVCHGGLILGALALWEHAPELAEQIIARGLENLPRALHEYEPDGVYPEGPSYWAYGTSFNVLLIDALESALGTDFGIASAHGLTQSPHFMLHATGPTGLYFNFADCGTSAGVEPALHWFARRAEQPSLLWHQREALARLAASKPADSGAASRMLVFLLVWARPISETPPPAVRHWHGQGPSPVGMHRSGWDADSTFVGIKGGSPSTNHGHMDIGSFVLDARGVRWAVDLGMQDYHSLESKGIGLWNRNQDSERWTVFRLGTFSHNTLVVNGEQQRVEGHAPITAFVGENDRAFTVVDMSAVYDGQLEAASRGVRLLGRSVLVQDELVAIDQPARVRWGMATRAAVTLDGATATLEQDGQVLTLRVLHPAGAVLQVLDMETPPQPYDAKNPDTRMLAFEVSVPGATGETIAVLLEPGAPSEPPALTPLARW